MEIGDVSREILFHTMLAVSTTDTTLLHSCVEALDCLEVEAVDIGLAKLQLTTAAGGNIQVVGEDLA